MDNPFAAVRYALRQFRSSPVFTAAAVLTLALGIGGTTAIFTLIHAVMLRSLPVADPASLYRIGDGDDCCVQGGPQDRWGMFSFPLFERLKAETPEFEQVAAFQAGGARVSVRREGVDAAARPLRSEFVTGNYFTTLGVGAFGGRMLSADDDKPGGSARRGAQPSFLAGGVRRRRVRRRRDVRHRRAPVYDRRRRSGRDFSATRCEAIRPTCGFRCSRSR